MPKTEKQKLEEKIKNVRTKQVEEIDDIITRMEMVRPNIIIPILQGGESIKYSLPGLKKCVETLEELYIKESDYREELYKL